MKEHPKYLSLKFVVSGDAIEYLKLRGYFPHHKADGYIRRSPTGRFHAYAAGKVIWLHHDKLINWHHVSYDRFGRSTGNVKAEAKRIKVGELIK